MVVRRKNEKLPLQVIRMFLAEGCRRHKPSVRPVVIHAAQEHTQPEASGKTKRVYTPQSAVTTSLMPDQVIDNHSCDFSAKIPPAPNQNQAAQGLAHMGSSVH